MDSNWKRENMRQCDPIRDGRASKEFDRKRLVIVRYNWKINWKSKQYL